MKKFNTSKYLFILFIFFSTHTFVAALFNNISEIQTYAQTHPEFIEIDNENWTNPDFSSFHKAQLPGLLNRFLSFVGLAQPLWTAQDFKTLLKNTVNNREHNGLIGRYINKITPKSGDNFIIFGDVHGAFHSMVRVLNELKSKAIINDDLKIINPAYYIIFNGNIIDRSAYTLETLSLVMRLIEMNPNHIFYIRGNHEDKQYWHSFGLARELTIRCRSVSDTAIPLNGMMTRFFNTLPLALYLPDKDMQTNINVVRISYYGTQYEELDETRFAGFLQDENYSFFKLDQEEKSEKKVVIKALIRGENRTTSYKRNKGLVLLDPEEGITTWSVLSSPTDSQARLYSFFHDAWAQITTSGTIENWTIALYNQDIREFLGFKQSKIYNLVSGQKISSDKKINEKIGKNDLQKVDDIKEVKKLISDLTQDIRQLTEKIETAPAIVAPEEKIESIPDQEKKQTDKPVPETQTIIEKSQDITKIKDLSLGSSMDLSRGARIYSKHLKNGIEHALKQNEPNIPQITFMDDQYSPEKTKSNIEQLLKQEIDIIFSPVGSPNITVLLDLIKEKKILVLFPITGATNLRQADLENIIHFRPSYAAEAHVLANTIDSQNVIVFYQNDELGTSVLQGLDQLEKTKEWLKIPYERNDVNFPNQVEKIKKTNPDALLFASTSIAAQSLIRQIDPNYLKNKKLLGISDLSEKSFHDFIKKNGLSITTSNVVPNPQTSDIELIKEFRKSNNNNELFFEPFALEGYINTALLLDFLKKVDGPIDKEKIIKVAQEIKNYTFQGLELDFDDQTRELSHYLWLNTGNDKWEKIDIKKIKKIPAAEEKTAEEKTAEEKTAEEKTAEEKTAEEKDERQKELIFGTLIDFSKALKFIDPNFLKGAELRFKETQAQGGINGTMFKLIPADSEYDPIIARAAVEKFLKDGINKLIIPSGSPTNASYLDLVKEKKVLSLFPSTGGTMFRKPEYEYMIHWRSADDLEGKVLVEYAHKKLDSKKAVIFYQNDEFGKELLNGGRQAIENLQLNKDDWIEISHDRNVVVFDKQVEEIKKIKPDAILFFGTTSAAKSLIRQLGIENLTGVHLLGNSDFKEVTFINFIEKNGLKLIHLSTTPNLHTSDLEIVEQYRQAGKKHDVITTNIGLESYICADIAFYLMSKIQGKITSEKIIQEAEKIKDLDYKGLHLNFNPERREIADTVWLRDAQGDYKAIQGGL